MEHYKQKKFYSIINSAPLSHIIFLVIGGIKTTTDLIKTTKLRDSLLSKRLRILEDNGFIIKKREGKTRYLYINNEPLIETFIIAALSYRFSITNNKINRWVESKEIKNIFKKVKKNKLLFGLIDSIIESYFKSIKIRRSMIHETCPLCKHPLSIETHGTSCTNPECDFIYIIKEIFTLYEVMYDLVDLIVISLEDTRGFWPYLTKKEKKELKDLDIIFGLGKIKLIDFSMNIYHNYFSSINKKKEK
ncbi:helix-turn-helix transcriptional regulator [Candidatus Woesearchaeota archaeon]|nr:helix-turn-helix transcriptional regulator [Candidatus Woesearchaeota archaeon]